jgi:hypothetical protein
MRRGGATAGGNLLSGTVRSSVYLGGVAQHEVALDVPAGSAEAVVRVSELNPKSPLSPGERVAIEIDADDVVPLAN